jgi:hypothetical protein
VLQIKAENRVFTMFLEQTPWGKKFVVYEDTEKGCVLYNFIADQLSEFGCSDNEVIVRLPTREAYFINILVKKRVLISTDKYVEGKKEKLPIYVVNFEEAEKIGLNIVSQDLVFRWEMDKCNEQ